MEEKLKAADLHGHSVDVQFSISKSKKMRCSVLCWVYKHDRKDKRMVENILCCYSNDDKSAGVIDKAYLLHVAARSVTAFVNILPVLLLLTRHR